VVREAVSQLRANGTLTGTFGARLEAAVAEGRPFHDALALFPDEVPKEDLALIEAGEATGNLDRTLDRLADRHETRRDARRRFLTDALYPLILFHLAALITPVVTAFPKDGRLFGPSWTTRVVVVLLPFYALVGATIWLHRSARGRARIRRIVDFLPGFGNAARHRRRADFAEVTGAAYEAGVQMDRALELAGNSVEEPRVLNAALVVARGSTLRDALGSTSFLPGPLLSRIAVGEQAGELGKVLEQIAREEAEASEHILRRSTLVLSKAIYIAVAAWILIYVVSTYLGIYGDLLK